MRSITPEYMLAALRQVIKSKGLTYRELSGKMGVPLSTFKRHLYSQNIALDKLLEYCHVVDSSLDELQKIADQLQAADEDYFSRTQDEVFFQFPMLYDFYREIRMLRGKDIFNIMRERHHLSDESMQAYLGALVELEVIEVSDDNQVTLIGPLFYSLSENSKLNEKYTEIILQQSTREAKCVRVALSRMNVTEEQLLELEDMMAKKVLEFHTQNVESANFDVNSFSNILMVAGPHEPVQFCKEGIQEQPRSFVDEVSQAILQVGEKPSQTI